MFFKVLSLEGKFLGVADETDLRKVQEAYNLLLFSELEQAQFVKIDGVLYRDNWFNVIPKNVDIEYTNALVEEITEEEYNLFAAIIEENKEVPAAMIVTPVEEEVVEEINYPQADIEFLREKKLETLSRQCEAAVYEGFDLEIDGEVKHFSLTIQDQLNMLYVQNSIISNPSLLYVVYHADGEDYKDYSVNTMNKIIEAAQAHKTAQVLHFKMLKDKVLLAQTAAELVEIKY